MGFFDKLLGKDSSKCAFCKKEDVELEVTKKTSEGLKRFCSKKCSREYRKKLRRKDRKPQSGSGSSSGLWW